MKKLKRYTAVVKLKLITLFISMIFNMLRTSRKFRRVVMSTFCKFKFILIDCYRAYYEWSSMKVE